MAFRGEVVAKMAGGRLEPAASSDRHALSRVEDGQLFTLLPYRPRSDRQNRYLHAMIGKAVENSPEYWTDEIIKTQVKLRNGWVRGAVTEIDGRSFVLVRSSADFDLAEMKKFIEQTKEYILTVVCPGMDESDLDREVEAEIAPARQVRS